MIGTLQRVGARARSATTATTTDTQDVRAWDSSKATPAASVRGVQINSVFLSFRSCKSFARPTRITIPANLPNPVFLVLLR